MSLRTREFPIVPITDEINVVTDTDSKGTSRFGVPGMGEVLADTFLGAKLYQGKELTLSWEELSARCKVADFSNIHIGDYKIITVGDETVELEVAGIDTYYNCGNTAIKHHIDFISKDCLQTAYKFNATATNNGGGTTKNPWLDSELYKQLNGDADSVYSKLPEDLKAVVITKLALLEQRSGGVTASTGWAWNDAGKVWIPTEREIWGSPIWGEITWSGGGGCNIQYPIFCDELGVVKGAGYGGERCHWWNMSACKGNATDFCETDDEGSANHAAANEDNVYVCIGIRIA